MKKTLTAVLIGAGNRGYTYSSIMASLPDAFRIVAVADPNESRRRAVQQLFDIPEESAFDDWRDLLAQGKIADLALVCTMDRQHAEPALQAISLGYHLLLEKPVSPDPAECVRIEAAAKAQNVSVTVCHVLRYTPFFMAIKKLIDRGELGEVQSVTHEEGVGNVHHSHSFVRGNWGNSERSSFMLLQKSCHDVDILQWLIGKRPKSVHSFGSLSHFVRKNAPEGSPERCIDGCPAADACPYNAVKLYLDDKQNDWFRTTCTREAEPTDESVERALRTTQYGKCVYKCDNDVVDHQSLNILYEDGSTAVFNMSAFTKGGRRIRIMGTKAELRGALDGEDAPLELYRFDTGTTEYIPVTGEDGIAGGHGGGDEGIIRCLYDYLAEGVKSPSLSDISASVASHMTVFAAEESRLTGQAVDCAEYEARIRAAAEEV